MNAARSFLLMIGDDGALLVPPFNAREADTIFAAGHGSEQALPVIDALLENPRVPVLIVADTLSQEYRRETLPRLNFLDRGKLLARRLGQHFPAPAQPQHTQLTAAFPLKNGAALFACIHDGGPVTAWIKRLESLDNPFTGVAPLPLACAGMIAQLMPEARRGWAMLLSQQRTGGFRQIVTLDGDLAFTRLTPPLPAAATPSYMTATLALDIQATLGYLTRLGLSGDEPLRLAAIMPKAMHQALGIFSAPVQTALTITPHEAARRLGLTFAPGEDDPNSDLLYAAWVAKKNPACAVMLPEEKRQSAQTANIKRWGYGVAALLWLATLSHLGMGGRDLFRLVQNYRQATMETALLQTRWASARAALTPATRPLGMLRQAVARKRLFTAPAPAPWPLLEELDKATRESARVTHLDWQTGKDGENASSLRISLRLTEFAPSMTTNEAGRQTIIRRFDQLADSLRSVLPAYEITVAKYPFLVKPDETLSNAGDKTGDLSPPVADFLLRKEGL